jgi:hypothetical protein
MNRLWNKKTFIISLTLLSGIFLLSSCSEQKDGDWDDNIKLSKKEATFDVLSDSTTFTTEGDWWWISDIFLNGVAQEGLENINTAEDSFEILSDEFIIRRIRKTELFVKMEENVTGEIRVLEVGFQAGNYFDGVTITQNGE